MAYQPLTRVRYTPIIPKDYGAVPDVKTFSTVEIAAKIQRAGEDREAAVNRVKSWVREGLLYNSLVDPEPGVGRSRQYTKEALIDALLLEVLTQTLEAPAKSFKPHLSFLRYGLTKPDPLVQFLFVGLSSNKKAIRLGACSTNELAKHISASKQEVFVVLDVKTLLKRFENQE